MINKKMEQIMMENDNKLPIGMYQILFLDENNNVYCHNCASQLINDDDITLVDMFIHWEGESMYCEGCNVELLSEYGEPMTNCVSCDAEIPVGDEYCQHCLDDMEKEGKNAEYADSLRYDN